MILYTCAITIGSIWSGRWRPLFYAYCVLALVFIALLLAFDLLVLVVATRFGLPRIMLAPIAALVKLCGLIIKSLFLRRGTEWGISLEESQAPEAYAAVRDIADRTGVSPPDEILLEMHDNASVLLRGYGRGRGRCTLTVGYDMLAVLTKTEFEGVIAHEMAHAKLVHRAYQIWLSKAVARMAQLATGLDRVIFQANNERIRLYAGNALRKGCHLIGKAASRAFARYQRQDEFAADELAARICVHQKLTTTHPLLALTTTGGTHLLDKARICALTGCYLRTYEENTSGYGELKSYPPTAMGGIAIRINPRSGEMEGMS